MTPRLSPGGNRQPSPGGIIDSKRIRNLLQLQRNFRISVPFFLAFLRTAMALNQFLQNLIQSLKPLNQALRTLIQILQSSIQKLSELNQRVRALIQCR
jgi:hypothetical protein